MCRIATMNAHRGRCPLGLVAAIIATILPALGMAGEAGSAKRVWYPAQDGRPGRLRGFNLLEKFHLSRGNRPFVEEDFRLIHELGFNFVRLPMDYRCWIVDGDWTAFDEKTLEDIDRAVDWGKKYAIHVCINFHRAPGYTVARPPEKKSLWNDPAAQRVCASHWRMFARRYRDIPPERLSFNLVNEPARIDEKTYAPVAQKLIDAIRAEDADRPVVSDGLQWGKQPCRLLSGEHLIQATRGYQPMTISHYRASWIRGSETMPRPTWPMPAAIGGYLYGPAQKNMNGPMKLIVNLDTQAELRLHVMKVSNRAELVVRADGKRVWKRSFVCGPGKGEWKKAVYAEKWKIYQNSYDKDYLAEIPPGTKTIELAVIDGDWMLLSGLGIRTAAADEAAIPLSPKWGAEHEPVTLLRGDDGNMRFDTGPMRGREWLGKTHMTAWLKYAADGGKVFVGEWGAFNRTPHDVVLRWMEDCLKNWKEAGWGWALWNFRGPFGIIDSGRKDVEYEKWQGHQLDRNMLELLRKY